MAIVINKEYIANVAKLLVIDYETFDACFQFKTRKIGGSVINSPLKYDEAVALQNSFAKNLYEKIFHYLVTKLN
jgi:myosin heavy subunit